MAMPPSNTDLRSSSNNKKVIWFWQSNSDLWYENEPKEWKRYSDFENEFIESAFQQQEKVIYVRMISRKRKG